jgi:hypothetical protein
MKKGETNLINRNNSETKNIEDMFEFNDRLNVFLAIAYDNKYAKVAHLMELPLVSLLRWKEGKNLKLNNLYLLENAGCNIGWLIKGMGTMFAHNGAGIALRNDPEVIKRLKDYYTGNIKAEYQSEGYNELLEQVKGIVNQEHKYKKFFELLKDWYHDLNKRSHYTLVNFYFSIIEETFKQIPEDKYLNLKGEVKENDEIYSKLKEVLPLGLAFLDNYLGPDSFKILESIPNLFENIIPNEINDK